MFRTCTCGSSNISSRSWMSFDWFRDEFLSINVTISETICTACDREELYGRDSSKLIRSYN